MHHKAAIDEFTQDRLTRLAEVGYLAAAPELYHRTPDLPLDAKMSSLRDDQIVVDSVATLAAVKTAAPVRDDQDSLPSSLRGGPLSKTRPPERWRVALAERLSLDFSRPG
jgi:dienelactone hydrolase